VLLSEDEGLYLLVHAFAVSGNRPNFEEIDYAVPSNPGDVYVVLPLRDDLFEYLPSSLLNACVMAYKNNACASMFPSLS